MKEEVGTTPVYSMGVAERLTGLTGRQIRYWEHHDLLTPSRTQGRQRMYSETEILKLKEIKRLLGEGMTIERVKAYLTSREAKRARQGEEMLNARLNERIPRVGPLYGGSSRAEVQRMMDRKTDK